jgi:origin recognition complex subunit 1
MAAYLRSLPLASKLFLAALLARLRRTGITESTLAEIVDEAKRMGTTSQSKPLEQYLLTPDATPTHQGEEEGLGGVSQTPSKRGRPAAKKEPERAARVMGMGNAAVELAEAGIVGLESRHGDRIGRVRLGVGEEEVRNALREDVESQGLGFNA